MNRNPAEEAEMNPTNTMIQILDLAARGFTVDRIFSSRRNGQPCADMSRTVDGVTRCVAEVRTHYREPWMRPCFVPGVLG